MQYIDTDGGEYFINFGHKVELVLLTFFKGYFENGEFLIDKELKWLSATSDGIFIQKNSKIPIEIKSIETEKETLQVVKDHYHQLNIIMRVNSSNSLLLIIYRRKSNMFNFYRVTKDPDYDHIYLPLIEKGFYKHLLSYVCKNLNTQHLNELMSTEKFQKRFCRYFNGDFNETAHIRKRLPKKFLVTEIAITELIDNQGLRNLVKDYTRTYFHRTRRIKLYYHQFERLFKEKTENLYKDFDIQHLSVVLVDQMKALISK